MQGGLIPTASGNRNNQRAQAYRFTKVRILLYTTVNQIILVTDFPPRNQVLARKNTHRIFDQHWLGEVVLELGRRS